MAQMRRWRNPFRDTHWKKMAIAFGPLDQLNEQEWVRGDGETVTPHLIEIAAMLTLPPS
jgi:hypothetical protein